MSDLTNPMGEDRHQKVLYVGGAMRSGTTVIHRALCQARNSNPYISESWYLHDQFNLFAWNMERFEVRHADQFGEPEKLTDIFKFNLHYYLNLVSDRYDNPELLILKHPELTRHFLTLRKMMPGSKFLVIVRDPRDVIGSIKMVNQRHRASRTWSPTVKFQVMAEYCSFYMKYYKTIIEERGLFGDDLMFVRYEDVVTDPAKTFARISAFSGAVYEGDEMVKFDPASTDSKNLTREVRLKDAFSGAFWSDLYTKDLSTESIGTYKERLTPTETQEVQTFLFDMGSEFGYW